MKYGQCRSHYFSSNFLLKRNQTIQASTTSNAIVVIVVFRPYFRRSMYYTGRALDQYLVIFFAALSLSRYHKSNPYHLVTTTARRFMHAAAAAAVKTAQAAASTRTIIRLLCCPAAASVGFSARPCENIPGTYLWLSAYTAVSLEGSWKYAMGTIRPIYQPFFQPCQRQLYYLYMPASIYHQHDTR